MSAMVPAISIMSNPRRDKCADDLPWAQFFSDLFPENTAAYVASLTRTKVRAAEYVLEGRNGLGGRALANLLRSPIGPRVLNFIAGDAEWRAVEMRRLQIADLEQQLQDLELKKRELADAIAAPRR